MKTPLILAVLITLFIAMPDMAYCTKRGRDRSLKGKSMKAFKKPDFGKEKRKAKNKVADYKKSKWKVQLDKNGNLTCYGAGHGSWGTDAGVSVAGGVDDFWTAGSWRGPVIVYRVGNSYYTRLMRYDSGEVVASGDLYPGGEVTGVRVDGRIYGGHIYFNLSNGDQTTYSIWQHPNLPGKVEKGIKH